MILYFYRPDDQTSSVKALMERHWIGSPECCCLSQNINWILSVGSKTSIYR